MRKLEAKRLISHFKSLFSTIIIETPNGRWDQGPDGDNIYETHLSYWYPCDYCHLGFTFSAYAGTFRQDGLIGYWRSGS